MKRDQWWMMKGFAVDPGRARLTKSEDIWFRVYGGGSLPLSPSNRETWFLHFPPETASEAERWTNAGLFGNAFWRVEALRVPAGVRYHEGRTEHERHFGRVPKSVLDGVHQLYVANPWVQGIRPRCSSPLRADVLFAPGPRATQ